MVYQLALAYLLGLEGVALLRAFGGEHDRGFTEARIAEIRRLLDHPELGGTGVTAERVGTVAGYRVWSRTYDRPGNGLFAFEEPLVDEILDPLPPGVALDAACGTGRHTGRLVARGHRVIGVDSSPDMLQHARARVPEADFRPGDLHRLPVPDDHVDVVVCALALVHLPRLAPAFREFARVLRPGGHLLITDVHHETVALGSVPRMRSAAGGPGLLPAYRHRAADYLAAALPLGLRVRRCEEPGRSTGPGAAGTGPTDGATDSNAADGAADSNAVESGAVESGAVESGAVESAAGEAADDLPATPGPWDDWPWSLVGIVPAAAAAAWNDAPAVMVWHFELPAS